MELLQNFQMHAGNLSLYQNKQDGKWHNLVNDPSTFTETSATAMILTAVLRGLEYGWLNDGYLTVAQNAWNGLKSSIDLDGTVHDIIGETGIKNTSDDYQPESTKYMNAAPGLGAVLRALAAVTKSSIDFEK